MTLLTSFPNANFDNNNTGIGSETSDKFGAAVGFNDDYIVVGAPDEKHPSNPNYTVGLGRVYVYARSTGNLLYSILPTFSAGTNPSRLTTSPSGYFRSFGYKLFVGSEGASKDRLVVMDQYGVFVFNLTTGTQIRENPINIRSSLALSNTYYAHRTYTASSGNFVPTVTVRNISTGNVVYTFSDPQDSEVFSDGFADADITTTRTSIALTDSYCLIADPRETVSGATIEGKAYLYNMSSGLLEHTFEPPEPATTSQFGVVTGLSQTHAFVSASTGNRTYAFKLSDKSLDTTFTSAGFRNATGLKVLIGNEIYNVDGTLIQTLPNPDPAPSWNSGTFANSGFVFKDRAILGDSNELVITENWENYGYAYFYSSTGATASASASLPAVVTLTAQALVPLIGAAALSSDATLTAEGRLAVIENASAGLAASFAVTANAVVRRRGAATLTASAQLTTPLAFVRRASMAAGATAAVSTSIGKISNAVVNLTSQFSMPTVDITPVSPVYIDDGYIDEGYYERLVRIRAGAALLDSASEITVTLEKTTTVEVATSSSANLSVQTGIIQQAASANSAEFTQTAQAGIVFNADIQAIALFDPSIVIDAQRIGVALLEAVFDLSATASTIPSAQATLDAIINLSLQAARIADLIAEQSAEFSAAIEAARTRETDSSMAASFELNTNFEILKVGIADLNAAFEQTAIESVTRDSDSALSASSNLIVDSGIITFNNVELNSSFELSALGNAQFVGNIVTETVASKITVIVKVGDFLIDLDSTSELTAQAQLFNGIASIMQSAAESSTFATVIRENQITTEISSDLTADSNITRTVSSDLDTDTALDADVARIADFVIDISSAMSFETSIIAQKNGEIIVQVISSLTASGTLTHDSTVALSSVSTQNTVLTRQRDASASLNSTATLAATVRLFVLLEEYVFVIPREHRTFSVSKENRSHTIHKENREFIIRG